MQIYVGRETMDVKHSSKLALERGSHGINVLWSPF